MFFAAGFDRCVSADISDATAASARVAADCFRSFSRNMLLAAVGVVISKVPSGSGSKSTVLPLYAV